MKLHRCYINDNFKCRSFPRNNKFAPLATLVDADADLDSIVTNHKNVATDTATEMGGELEGAKDCRKIKRKIRIEMKMAKETQAK